jgi:hypothetical protein
LPSIFLGDRSSGSGLASLPKKEYSLPLLSSSLELASRATALIEARMEAQLPFPIPQGVNFLKGPRMGVASMVAGAQAKAVAVDP